MKILVLGKRAGAYALAFLASAALTAAPGKAEPTWKRHLIDGSDKASGKLGADGVRLADADGDGRPDVVTGWENGDAIRVALNPGPDRVGEPWPSFTVGRVKGAEDAVFADLDADGVLDVVSCTEGKTRTVFVHWAPAPETDYAEEAAWKTEAIPVLEGRQMWMYCLPFDANGDGREDLILGSKNAGATVGWLEQPAENPRDLANWTYHPLYDAGWIMSVRTDDLDGDGDRDVIFSDRKGASTGVWWLENAGSVSKGKVGSVFLPARRLGLSGEEVMFVDVADVDADGRLDVLAAVRERDLVVLLQPEKTGAEWTERRFSFPANTGAFTTGTSKAVKWFPFPGEERETWRFLLTCERADGDAHGVLLLTGEPDAGGANVECDTVSVSGPEGVKYDRMELLDLDEDGDLDLGRGETTSSPDRFPPRSPSHGWRFPENRPPPSRRRPCCRFG